MKDKTFRTLVNEISGLYNKYHFTVNQLYSHYLFKWYKPRPFWGTLLGLVLVTVGTLLLLNFRHWRHEIAHDALWIQVVAVALFALGMTIIFAWRNLRGPLLSKEDFEAAFEEWLEKYPITNLVSEPSLHEAPNLPYTENDLHQYGSDHIIVVNEDRYVDLFVRNNYIKDWCAVVISQNGYPSYLVDKVQDILNRKPKPTISYLHDADVSMSSMQEKVRQFLTLPPDHRSEDLGLSTQDIPKSAPYQQLLKREPAFLLDLIPPARLDLSTGLILGTVTFHELLTPPRPERSSWVSSNYG